MINKITEEEINKIKQGSVLELPDSPTANGWKPNAIKQAIGKMTVGIKKEDTSIVSEINRVVEEANEELKNHSNATQSTNDKIVSVQSEITMLQNKTTQTQQDFLQLQQATQQDISNIQEKVEQNQVAVDRANAIAQDLEHKRDTNYYKGEKGDPGFGSGVFALQVKNGDLLVYQDHLDNTQITLRNDGYLVVDIK